MITCHECNKDTKGRLNEMKDFRGNTFALCCNTCQKKIKKMLDKLFFKYGGHKDKNGIILCSCRHSPAITSTEQLVKETLTL